MPPGVEVSFWIGYFWPDTDALATRLASCPPMFGTAGTVSVTLYSNPAPASEPSPAPEPSTTSEPPPALQPTTVDRSVDLGLRGHLRAAGTIVSDDATCHGDVAVVVQRKTSADWIDVASTTTDADGRFAIRMTDRAGRYRAVAPEISSPDWTCLKSVSSTLRHRH